MTDSHYSGELSEAFWELIHVLDDEKKTLYDLGVKLQDLEHEVLKKIGERYQFVERLKTENESDSRGWAETPASEECNCAICKHVRERMGPQWPQLRKS
jgi:hypothetical protein